jgi:hypothetical protein
LINTLSDELPVNMVRWKSMTTSEKKKEQDIDLFMKGLNIEEIRKATRIYSSFEPCIQIICDTQPSSEILIP